MTAAAAPRPRGRPRDPDIEPRVYAAALEIYSERGWYGFSLEAVSRVAAVGQAAIYRRWSGKADLLARAVAAAEPPPPTLDTGSSRKDLMLLGHHLISRYRGPSGVVGLRLVLDARTHP
ncbi:MAG: helix-turn-helix domain-containing protein, partial [Mycobacteriales bacterium]